MSPEFKQKLLDGYAADPAWQRVSKVLDINDSGGAVKLPFLRDNDGLIFRLDPTGGTGDHALMSKRLCIPEPCIKDILEVVHGEGHPGYQRCLQKASAWYIRNLARHIRQYLQHCPQCHIYQTTRHKAYDFAHHPHYTRANRTRFGSTWTRKVGWLKASWILA